MKNNNILTMNEVNKLFTEKVAWYLNNGFILNSKTMAGHQGGEIGKVDVTNGKAVYRILLCTAHTNFNEPEEIRLQVRMYTMDKVGAFGTIWNNDGEVVDETVFYEIEREKAYTFDKEYINRLAEIRDTRLGNRDYFGAWKDLKTIDTKVVLGILKNRAGYKRVKEDQIKRVRKHSRTHKFQIEVENKGQLKHIMIG